MFCAKDSGVKLSPVQLMPGLKKLVVIYAVEQKSFYFTFLNGVNECEQEADDLLEGQIARGGLQQRGG